MEVGAHVDPWNIFGSSDWQADIDLATRLLPGEFGGPMRLATSPNALTAPIERGMQNFGHRPGTDPNKPILHMLFLDAAMLNHIMPELKRERANLFACPLGAYLFKYEINTLNRISAFIGNTAVESGQYNSLEEPHKHWSVKRLMQVFPHEFPTPASAEAVHNDPEALSNIAYAHKDGNGAASTGAGICGLLRLLVLVFQQAESSRGYRPFQDCGGNRQPRAPRAGLA